MDDGNAGDKQFEFLYFCNIRCKQYTLYDISFFFPNYMYIVHFEIICKPDSEHLLTLFLNKNVYKKHVLKGGGERKGICK